MVANYLKVGKIMSKPPASTEFVLNIMGFMLNDAHNTTNTLINNLMSQNKELRARLDLIEMSVTALVGGPYMPTPAAIRACFYPTMDDVARHIEMYEGEF